MIIQKPELIFNPKLFNPLFWHIKYAFEDPSIRVILLYGGSSASKTYSLVQACTMAMLEGPDQNTMVFRKYAAHIRDSIYSDYKRVIRKWNISQKFAFQLNYIPCETGSYTRFRGLDDEEDVKGISDFKKIILEELSQFEYGDFKQIRKRLRGMAGQQIVGLFNPIVDSHWIKTELFDKEKFIEQPTTVKSKTGEDQTVTGKWLNEQGNTLIIKTTYLDNKYIVGPYFVDQHVIDDMERDKEFDYDYYQVYALGNWGALKNNSPWCFAFRRDKHVAKEELFTKRDEILYLSFDFNRKPAACVVVQEYDGVTYGIEAIKLPNTGTEGMCKYVKEHYPGYVYMVTGDYSGNTSSNLFDDDVSNFTIIQKELNLGENQMRLFPNPRLKENQTLINSRLAYANIQLCPVKCKPLIWDMENVRQLADGTIEKRNREDPAQQADILDCWRYRENAFHYDYLTTLQQ